MNEVEIVRDIKEDKQEKAKQQDSKNDNGKTAFHLACQNGHSKVVEMLIQISAKIGMKLNEKDDIGRTGFHWASCNGNEEAVETILDHSGLFGLDLTKKDNDGKTALRILFSYILESFKTVKEFCS